MLEISRSSVLSISQAIMEKCIRLPRKKDLTSQIIKFQGIKKACCKGIFHDYVMTNYYSSKKLRVYLLSSNFQVLKLR